MTLNLFGGQSIARKLTWMNLYVTAAALLFAGLAFLVYDQVTFRQRMVLGMSAQAEMIGANSASALTFDDPDAAIETLSALRHSPTFIAAAIFTPEGKKFADYSISTRERIDSPPTLATGETEGHWFYNNRLLSAHTVEFQGKTLGIVYILASLQVLQDRLLQFLQITLGVLFLSMLAAMAVSSAFRRRLVNPIADLAETATTVSRAKNYSVRAPGVEGRDELAMLINSFNEMLSQIESRDADLETERARLRAVVDNAPVGILFAEAPSGQILFGNRRVEEILHHPSLALSNLSTGNWIAYHADGTRLTQEEFPLFRAVMKGATVRGEEHLFQRGDQTMVWLRSSAAPIRAKDGSIVGGVMAFNDIDEEKKAEQMLRQAYERLAIAQSTANMSDWEWDFRSNRVSLSADAERQHGFSPGAFDGSFETLTQAVIEADRAKFTSTLQAAAKSVGTVETDYRVLDERANVRWLLTKAIVRNDDHGSPRGMLGVTMDITTLRLAQEALLQSEKLAAAGRLAASISHEINNPLESVTNLLFLVASDPGLSASTREFVRQAEEELARVTHIATQTLRFYRQTTKPTNADIGRLLDSVIALHRGRLANMRVNVTRQYRTNTPLLCFEGEIRQVFTNLIGNALDAILEKHGKIVLRTAQRHDWSSGKSGILVTVADNGSGIPPETLSRIFEPFFSTKGNRGTGLGLWVTRELIAKHKGTLRVRSRVGSGTVFCVFFPTDGMEAPARSDSAMAS